MRSRYDDAPLASITPNRCCRKTTRQTTHHRAHHLDDYPDQVTIVRSRHPFEGSALNVLGWCHRRGELHLTLVLPDGTRALVPAAWTDLPIAQHLPRASPQCARAAFLASHAELLHARTIVDALLRQLDAAQLSCHRNRRTAMQQLSFLDPPPQRGAVPVWEALDKEQRAHLVLRLARLIARAIATAGDHNDERTEQDHR